jgi:hypothetical protein
MSLIQRYRDSQTRTLAAFAITGSALNKTYAPGKWTVQQMLVHLADSETVLFARVRRCIAEEGAQMNAFDPDLWAAKLAYEQMPLAVSRDLYRATRAAVIDLAQRFGETHAHRTYLHSEAGERTLAQELEKIAFHNEHHLEQIERALAS